MRIFSALWVLSLVLSTATLAAPLSTREVQSEKPEGGTLPLWPDCSVHAACLCPWHAALKADDFKVVAAARVPRHVVQCPGQSECEWHLFDDSRGVAVYHSRPDYRRDVIPVERRTGLDEPAWEAKGSRYVVEVDDGWIVALDSGEFGAGLWWVAGDGSKYRKLGEPHVVELIKTKVGVLAPTGLDHLVNGRGGVLLIKKGRDGAWKARNFAAIGASAYAATTAADGSILVVTRTSLIKVGLDKTVSVLHRGQWSGFFEVGEDAESAFYPGSVVVRTTGQVFIGMRAAVVLLTPRARGYFEEWLAPAACLGRK